MTVIQADEIGENKNAVSRRHREEWQRYREETLLPAIENHSEAEAKFAKVCADCLKIYQEGERKAWGFADGEDSGETSVAWEE